MKNKMFLSIILFPFLLVSCGDGVGSKTFYIDRSEEVSAKYEDDTLAYSNHAYYKNWSEIKPQLEMGVSLFVILTQTTCSHCNTFKNTFISFCQNNSLAYGVIERNGSTTESYYEYHAQIDSINEYYGYDENNENYIQAATPSVVGMNQTKAFEIIGGAATAARLTTEMKRFCTYTNIYRSRTTSSINDQYLTYLLDSSDESSNSFFKDKLYQRIKTSKKRVNIVDYTLMDNENKKSLLDKYGLESYTPLLISGSTKVDIKNDPEVAESLVNSYLN